MLLLEKRQTNNSWHTVWKQRFKKCLGHTVERLFAHLRAHPKEASFTERCLWEQSNWSVPFPFTTLQFMHRATCRKQLNTHTSYLTSLHQALLPYALVEPPLPVKLAGLPMQWALPQGGLSKLLLTLNLSTLEFCGASIFSNVSTGLISQTDQSTPG